MSNIKPIKPSFVFGYWRPWNENSNIIDSYLDYSKDVSLVKYGADTVGKYINYASKEQVQAINQLGKAIGMGLDVLSNQMSDISNKLGFLNRNMDIQIEQQKLSNLLLENIAELLRVPDSEKERQHSIELGIKFFVNATKDSDLYADALEELLNAETLMKQDYFVLHRIGCIYLYAEKYINPEKALDYFLRAAKYASIESDPEAMRLVNALSGNFTLYKIIIEDYGNAINFLSRMESAIKSKYKGKLPFLTEIIEANAKGIKAADVSYSFLDFLETISYSLTEYEDLIKGIVTNNSVKKKIQDSLQEAQSGISKKEAQGYFEDFEELGLKTKIIPLIKQSDEINVSEIKHLAANSYEKAAFAAYVLGRFEDAVNYQTKALKFDKDPQNRFLLSKYQVRNSNIQEAIVNLSECIDQLPTLAIAAFKEIDLINEPEVIKLITEKNDAIDNKIKQLTLKWKTVESTKANEVIYELTELSQKSYEIKIADFNKYEKEGNTINTGITELEANIDAYINEIKKTTYCTFDADKIQKIIKELQLAKDLPLEKMQAAFHKVKKYTDADILRIGSHYGGGIVIWLDNSGKHGLVCANKDFGEAVVWGGSGEIGANGNGIADGSGMANTKKIVELASWYIEKGFFSSTKTPASTAARICLESNHNDYNDWYLPTIKELDLLYEYRDIVGGFAGNDYWSSTAEKSNFDFANYKYFSNGHEDFYGKGIRYNKYAVRAMRAF